MALERGARLAGAIGQFPKRVAKLLDVALAEQLAMYIESMDIGVAQHANDFVVQIKVLEWFSTVMNR